MIIWDCCCIKVNICWKFCICSCCCLVCCRKTWINSGVAFWTAAPSYSQPLVAASVAAFLPFSISAWGRFFLANMPQCHLHFFNVLPFLLFHSLPHLSFVFSVSLQGSLELCFSFPLLWHYRLSFYHFVIAFLVSRRSLYSQVFGMKKPLVKTFEGVYIEQEPKDDLCWKKCLSSLYRAHHVHPALAKQKKLNPTRFTGRQIKVQYVCVVFNHVP